MRKVFLGAAALLAASLGTSADAQLYHVSSRVLTGTGQNTVFMFDAAGVLMPGMQYVEGGSAAADGWGYRDGTEDGTYVYFGWGGGVFQHLGANGGSPVQIYPNGGPNGTWRALGYDADGIPGFPGPGIWSASFSTALVFANMTGGTITSYPAGGWSLYGLDIDETDGNLWGHDTAGTVIKIDTTTGAIIPGAGWANGFANLAAQGGLSGHHDGSGLVAAVSQGTPDELGVYDSNTGTLILGPWNIDIQTGENGALGVACFGFGGGTCPEDINGDGVVDVLDLLALLAAWGNPGGPEDINGDGVVDVLDLLMLLAAWGPCGPGEGACCIYTPGPDGVYSCEDLTEMDCIIAGGYEWVAGETCATYQCPTLPDGACCYFPSGNCDDLNVIDCNAAGGNWEGAGTNCATTTCPTGPGDTIADATPITLPYSSSADTTPYNNDYDEVCPYTGSMSNDCVYSYTADFTGTISITLCAMSSYDTKLYVYDTPTPVTFYACNDDACVSGAGQSFVSEILGMNVTNGTTYYIVVDGYGSNNGYFTIDVTTP